MLLIRNKNMIWNTTLNDNIIVVMQPSSSLASRVLL